MKMGHFVLEVKCVISGGLRMILRMFVVIFEIVIVVTKKQDLHLIHPWNATFWHAELSSRLEVCFESISKNPSKGGVKWLNRQVAKPRTEYTKV